MRRERKSAPSGGNGKNALEWIVFALSAVLILAILGMLIHEATGWKERPPQLVTSLGDPHVSGDSLAVPVEVSNRGDTAATDVEVTLTLPSGGSARVRFDFIPRDATRRGDVTLPSATDTAAVRISAVTHAEP